MTIDDQAQNFRDNVERGPFDPDMPPAAGSDGLRPTLIIVSGPPGSGKTTLARKLARALGCPLLSRDEINEGIFHTFNHDLAVASRDSVAKLTFNAFFRAIELLLSAQVSIVVEAAFQDYRWRLDLKRLVTGADLKVIHCEIDPELAGERLLRRRLTGPDTPGTRRAAQARRAGRDQSPAGGFESLSLPVPALAVATTEGYEPGLDDIVKFAKAGRA